MKKHSESESSILDRARPLGDQHSIEIQPYGTIAKLPIALAESACKASVENLNQLLADTITLRDMYKKHHWQVAGPTFYRTNELQVWFLSEHVVPEPLVHATRRAK
jgi:starvation-inducible DNA-binding protein